MSSGPVEGVAGAAVLLAATLAVLAVRRRWLLGRGGVDMSMRLRDGRACRGWALGIAYMLPNELWWYRVFAFARRPSRVLQRDTLLLVSHRCPRGAESWAVQAGAVILECRGAVSPVRLAVSPDALPCVLSWLEPSSTGDASSAEPA